MNKPPVQGRHNSTFDHHQSLQPSSNDLADPEKGSPCDANSPLSLRSTSLAEGKKMPRYGRIRKSYAYWTFIILASWLAYIQFLRPAPTQLPTPLSLESALSNGTLTEGFEMDEIYDVGTNARPEFTDMIQLKDLDTQFIPDTGRGRRAGRLVIIGDVHGMKNELVKLLDKVSFNEKRDHLVLAGDFISKGPDSPGLIDLAMNLKATALRGNHEDRVLLAWKDLRSRRIDAADILHEHVADDLEVQGLGHGDYKDRALAKQLNDKQVAWLKKCPVILRVGDVDGMGEVIVVHAGLVPGVKLEVQDPFNVMNMRTIDPETNVPSENREGTPWTKVWNRYQKHAQKGQRSTVIYGHDSKRGLQIENFSKGIDTGCLKGGKLTALVIEGGSSKVTQKVVQVSCKDGRA